MPDLGDDAQHTPSATIFYLDDLSVNQMVALTPTFVETTGAPNQITGGTPVSTTATVASLKAVFKFRTDSEDLAEAEDDITGAADKDAWDGVGFNLGVLSVAQGDAVGGHADANVNKDYLRHFSKEVLGTERADLFSNEGFLLTTVANALSNNLNSTIETAIDENNGSIINDLYRTLSNDEDNVNRLSDLANNGAIQNDGTTLYDFPFMVGDQIVFKITVHHGDVSIEKTNIHGQRVNTKEYLVTMTLE